jgi:L-ascorbate metabolism protein UlaG (beta-lactamase superfamily)
MKSHSKLRVGFPMAIGVIAAAAQALSDPRPPRRFGATNNGVVAITPIGQRTGEYCARDRALLFEDPSGVRVLYDPGVTVSGGGDPRLGVVHAILVSHSHFDHIGYRKLAQNPDDPNAVCDPIPAPYTVPTANTTAAEIAAAKNSAVLVNGSMAQFLAQRIQGLTGSLTDTCPPQGVAVGAGPDEIVVPLARPCTEGLGFGSSITLTTSSGTPGVRINIVNALHSDSLFNPKLLFTAPLGQYMTDNGLTGFDGSAAGYVLTFTNGLTAYLTGDTGLMSDMSLFRRFYEPNLAVVNVDGVNVMGPEDAAFAVNSLLKPTSVIVSHAEQAATTNGQMNPNTRTAVFASLVHDSPVYLPLSGVTMQFNGAGRCVNGCTPAR